MQGSGAKEQPNKDLPIKPQLAARLNQSWGRVNQIEPVWKKKSRPKWKWGSYKLQCIAPGQGQNERLLFTIFSH